MTLVFAARDGKAADGANDRGVGERGLRGDDGVGNVMIDCLSRIESNYY